MFWNTTWQLNTPERVPHVGGQLFGVRLSIGSLQDLVTWYGINYAEDANNAVGLPKQRNSHQSSSTFLCFESSTALFASQIVQRAYFLPTSKFNFKTTSNLQNFPFPSILLILWEKLFISKYAQKITKKFTKQPKTQICRISRFLTAWNVNEIFTLKP